MYPSGIDLYNSVALYSAAIRNLAIVFCETNPTLSSSEPLTLRLAQGEVPGPDHENVPLFASKINVQLTCISISSLAK